MPELNTLSVYKDLIRNVPTAEYHIYGYFVIFLPILTKHWLPWQCPLDPCIQKCLLWIGRPRKPPVISNHILAISCRNSFICIYSNLVPKLVAMVTPLCSLCTGVSQTNSTIAQTLSQNQSSAWIRCIQLKLWPILWFLAYFGQNLVAMTTSLRPLQSEMSSLDWSTTKTPCIYILKLL